MLFFIIALLVIFWLLGIIGHIGGDLIHILAIIAVIVLLYKLLAGERL